MTLVLSVSGPTPWKKLKGVISGSTTSAIDSIPLSVMRSAKYFISMQNSSLGRYKSFELNAARYGAAIRDSISGKLASGAMDIEVEMKINGSNVELEVTNNETFDLEVEIIRGVLNV